MTTKRSEEVIVEVYYEEDEVSHRKLEIILASIVALLFLIAIIACLIIISPQLMCYVGTSPSPVSQTPPSPVAIRGRPIMSTSPRVIFNYSTFQKLNFIEAAEACEKMNSRLAFPASTAEEGEIESELRRIIDENSLEVSSRCGTEFFIGLRRNRAREWQSHDGISPVFGPALLQDIYGIRNDGLESCVQMNIDTNGFLNNIYCDNDFGSHWGCYLCEHDCTNGLCNYSLVNVNDTDKVQYTYDMAANDCMNKYKDGMLALVHHKRQIDEFAKIFSGETCRRPLIGNRYVFLYEDIYERPLLYKTKKIALGRRMLSDACVTINVYREPYRWTLTRCTKKLCFLCYNNE